MNRRFFTLVACGLLVLITAALATSTTSSGGSRPMPGASQAAFRSTTTTSSTTTTLAPVTTTTQTGGQGAKPPVYGVTIDDISNIKAIAAELAQLPVRATVRVVFDVGEPATYYRSAVATLHGVSTVMGEFVDSSDVASISPTDFQTRVTSYLATLGPSVDIWEIGNEVNGNWTGTYPDGSAKLTAAFTSVTAASRATSLTLYANEYAPNNCGDGTRELTPVQYSQRYVPAAVRAGLTYVFESYYPTECVPVTYPSAAEVAAEMVQLHALYPNAALGFGEMGLPVAVTSETLASAEQVMSWAYGLNPGLSYYVGGYFWWPFSDLFPTTSPLYPSFLAALSAEKSALGGG